MPMPIEDVRTLLKTKFAEDEVEIIDTMGNQDYYQITVTSGLFNRLSKIEQHKMVYGCLGDAVGRAIHSVTVTTRVIKED